MITYDSSEKWIPPMERLTGGVGRRAGAESYRRVVPDSLPAYSQVTTIDLDVTENCNLGCEYCFKGEKTSENMTKHGARAAFEWLLLASGSAKELCVNFMGGEPTMRWGLIRDFVPWAQRRGRANGKSIRFSMTSNLTLWTDEIRDFVDRWGFGVLMSIDGCPEVQDGQRPTKTGKKSSEAVEKWARSMLRTRPRSTARATLTPRFAGRVFDSVRYLDSIGFREIAISPCEYGTWTEDAFVALETQLSQVVDYVAARLEDKDGLSLSVWSYYIKHLIHPRKTGTPLTWTHTPCGAGKNYMMIDHRGDIWPCHRFDGADADAKAGGAYRLGNIHDGTFNVDLQRTFRDFDHRVKHKDMCNQCPVNEICGGYCPAANVSSTGSIYTPHDDYCRCSQLNYDAAAHLYDRVKQSPPAFSRMMELARAATSDGQR